MTTTLRLLMALGFLVQTLVIALSWHELLALIQSDPGGEELEALAFFISPSILGFGGAAAAAWLRRRGSAWAWVVVAVPFVLLAATLFLAAFLWMDPMGHQP